MNRAERRAQGVQKHPTVVLGYIHPGDVSAAFMASVMRCRDYELIRTQTLFGTLERRSRAGTIAKIRNQIVAAFLNSQAEYLWFVDADMGFPKTALQQLLATASKERPIVGGLCFAHRTEGFDEETNSETFGMIPTLHVFNEEAGEVKNFSIVEDYPRGQAVRVHSTGAACVLIHRSVLEEMKGNWFSHIGDFGEDVSFFLRAYRLGIPVWVNTAVRTSHDKGGIFLTEQAWDLQNERRAVVA